MKLEEENKALKDLVLTLNAYIPHRCYNCAYFEGADFSFNLEKIDWCLKHDRPTNKTDGCRCFKLVNGIYEKAERLGVILYDE